MNMNYELAKKLKDGGFFEKQYCYGDIYPKRSFPFIEWLPNPNLGELIKGCGDKFYSIVYRNKKWQSFAFLNGNVIETSGSNPEIAVAELWLELRKKV